LGKSDQNRSETQYLLWGTGKLFSMRNTSRSANGGGRGELGGVTVVERPEGSEELSQRAVSTAASSLCRGEDEPPGKGIVSVNLSKGVSLKGLMNGGLLVNLIEVSFSVDG